MSLSRPNESNHPCKRWMKWDAGEGVLTYWDKERGEKGENVVIGSTGFPFFVLDTLTTIKGFHERSNSGIVSNEVRDLRYESLDVRAFNGGNLCSGYYGEIKDAIKSHGGKFAQNVYVAFKDRGELAIGSIMFVGASLGPWFDFSKDNKGALKTSAVDFDGWEEGKKGRVTFRMPKFKLIKVAPETVAAAVKLDAELQEYLDGYLAKAKSAPKSEAHEQYQENRREADEWERSESEARPTVNDPREFEADTSDIPF